MIDDCSTAPCDFDALSFLQWREKLCPRCYTVSNCDGCDYFKGRSHWPDVCELYTVEIWREYLRREVDKYEQAKNEAVTA